MKSVFTKEYQEFISSLISARKSAGLTQQDLAERLSKPQSFVSKYERGERRLDVVEFVWVTRAIGIDASSIVIAIEEALDKK